MFFYQHDNSNRPGHIQIDLYDNFSFPIHLHSDLELAYPLSGAVRVQSRGREEIVHAGELALILPHELHGYAQCGDSRMLVCVFSADYVQTFVQSIAGIRGDRSVVPCPAGLRAYVEETFFDMENPGTLQLKAALYAVCAQYQRNVRFAPLSVTEDGVLEKLIAYVEENYCENITMSSAARAIGYNENYLSRCFHQATGINFRRFVNYHRIQCVCRSRQSDEGTLSELALASGFQNLRSFNRAFHEFLGMSPREYFGKQTRVLDFSQNAGKAEESSKC